MQGELTQDVIAAKEGLSQARVSEIITAATGTLREAILARPELAELYGRA